MLWLLRHKQGGTSHRHVLVTFGYLSSGPDNMSAPSLASAPLLLLLLLPLPLLPLSLPLPLLSPLTHTRAGTIMKVGDTMYSSCHVQ